MAGSSAGVDRTAADVYVSVNKASQRMTVMVDGKPRYNWAISSGLNGGPPSGTFRPQRLERMWHSRTYDWSPMPHSIFFHHGFAIHGTNYVSRLGRPASHGCVRLHPSNAAHAVRAGEGAWNGPHHHCDLGFLAPDGVSLILCTSFARAGLYKRAGGRNPLADDILGVGPYAGASVGSGSGGMSHGGFRVRSRCRG